MEFQTLADETFLSTMPTSEDEGDLSIPDFFDVDDLSKDFDIVPPECLDGWNQQEEIEAKGMKRQRPPEPPLPCPQKKTRGEEKLLDTPGSISALDPKDSGDSVTRNVGGMVKLVTLMERSELSGREFLRQQKVMILSKPGEKPAPKIEKNSNSREFAKMKTVAVFGKDLGRLDGFLNGSQSTITSGLALSRRMLCSYMA